MPTKNQIDSLYSDDYEFRVDETAEQRFGVQANAILDRLRTLYPHGKSLLDIGTGYGTFTEIAIKKGYDAVGIEPAKNLYTIAKRNLQSKVFHKSLDELKGRKFDFITLIHVVEHFRNPKIELGRVFKLLNPEGVVFLETPNIDSFLAKAENRNYTFLTPPDHIHLFSPNSLKKLVRRVSTYGVFTTITYSYPEHLVGVLRAIKTGMWKSESSTVQARSKQKTSDRAVSVSRPPVFDRYVAPLLTPALNLGNKGSILQLYVKTPDKPSP